jgi:hypothetical protein
MYSNPSTVGYSGGIIMSGPRAATLGTETTLTCNYIAKSGGGDHLYDSCIIDNGTTVCVNATLKASGQVCGVMGTFNCIGIGTTTPNKLLDIRGSDIYESSQLALSSVSGTNRLYLGTNNGAYISLGGTYTCSGLVTDGNNAMAQISMQAFDGGSYMNFATTTCNNVEPSTRMFISAVGNVSIGTALPPYAKLVVYKGVECGCIGKVLDTTIQLDGENYGACNWPAQIGFGYPSYGFTYNPVAIAYIPQTGVASGNADLAFYTRTATTDTAPSERFRIKSNGIATFTCTICTPKIGYNGYNGATGYDLLGHFDAGSTNIATLSGEGAYTRVVAHIEWVTNYALAGTNMTMGYTIADTRRGNSNSIWVNCTCTILAYGDSPSNPTFGWSGGVLSVSVPGSHGLSARFRITSYAATITPNI